jgi:hypothetical protein
VKGFGRGRKSFFTLAQEKVDTKALLWNTYSILGVLRVNGPPIEGWPMISLSLNYQGFGNSLRKHALKILVESDKIGMIMLQHTMGDSGKIIYDLGKNFMGWDFIFTNAHGHFSGLITRW